MYDPFKKSNRNPYFAKPKYTDEDLEEMALEYISSGKLPKANQGEVKDVAMQILNGTWYTGDRG